MSALIAQVGEAGMGKGMDGHAGKDLLVKVPAARWFGNCHTSATR